MALIWGLYWSRRATLQRYPFRPLHNQVRDIVREASTAPTTRSVDLLDSLAHRPAGDLWVHPTDHHPNEVAHVESEELKQLLLDTRK